QVCSTKMCAPMASSPRILNRPTGTNQTPRYAKSPSRSLSSLRVLRRQGAAKHKLARRQTAKLCYRCGPLTPFCALREPDRSDGTKNAFPAPNKEPTTEQKLCLTGKAPYRFESVPSSGEPHELREAPTPGPHRLLSNSFLARGPGPRRLRRSSCRHGGE